jgi:hypothetical protein
MSMTVTGLPALIFLIGFVVVFAAPVWVAARVVRARHATLLRSVASLLAGTFGTFALALLIGPWALLLAPVVYVLSFKVVLGTSVLGSILLAIVAAAGYALMGWWLGGGTPGWWPGGTGTGIEV